MRILFLSRWFPYPPDNGAKIRIFHLLKGLSDNHRVDLITFYEDETVAACLPELRKFCENVQAIPYQGFRPGRLKAVLGYLSAAPRSILDTHSREFAASVREAMQGNRFDLMIASEFDMLAYALPVRGPKKVLEELEVTKIRAPFQQEARWMKKMRSGMTWMKLASYLSRTLPAFDGCTVVSEQERDAVTSVVPQVNPAVIPNGVDTERIKPDPGVAVEPDTLVYNGAITYPVNFQAVAYFIERIFPLIRAKRPGTHLIVTGKINRALIERLPAHENVIFTGYVDDIRKVLHRCSVNVVPLTVGGGTRLKILESLAAGLPVVSTSIGAEGLKLVNGRDLLLADQPEEFAQSVLRILEDGDFRRRLAANGRKTVVEQYDWKLIVAQLEDYIRQVTVGNGVPESAA